MKKSILFLIVILGMVKFAVSQDVDNQDSPLSVSADVVSSFVWRGAVGSPTVNFQPSVTYSTGNLSIGTWGGTDIFGIYKEIDLFASYSFSGFSATITDYDWNPSKKYFDYDNASTGHLFEIGLSYENENFPLNIYAGTMFYGDDKQYAYDVSITDSTANNYSTYLQLSYTFDIKGNSLNVFMGATPFTGLYGKDFAVIYTGFTGSKDIKITDNYSLPISVTLAANPQSQDYFMVLGFTL